MWTDRQTDRQIDIHTPGQTDRQTYIHTHTWTHRQTYIQPPGHTDRQTYRHSQANQNQITIQPKNKLMNKILLMVVRLAPPPSSCFDFKATGKNIPPPHERHL